jgi:hypothetical protein
MNCTLCSSSSQLSMSCIFYHSAEYEICPLLLALELSMNRTLALAAS